MNCTKNCYLLIEMSATGIYGVWKSDLYTCADCGAMSVTGIAGSPIVGPDAPPELRIEVAKKEIAAIERDVADSKYFDAGFVPWTVVWGGRHERNSNEPEIMADPAYSFLYPKVTA
jgi:hypothetical protein